jgi:hypothetical protein
MRLYIIASLVILFFTDTYGQSVNDIIESVDDNRVMSMIRELSGEVEVENIGLILDRSNNVGKQKAIRYFENKFSDVDLTLEKEYFSNLGLNGINILATKKGVLYPDSLVIVCAHYDTVTEYCADDNASGVSAVLEAANVFSDIEFEKTIVYALWDLEENGLYGSKYHAFEAFNNNLKIAAVINADMIGYDSNSDLLFEVHTKANHENDIFYNKATEIVSGSKLELNPIGISFGAPNSDHSPFWTYDYPAVLITQGYWSKDFNPNYHSVMDRVESISEEFVTKLVRLIAGLTSDIAVVSNETNITQSNYNEFFYYDNESKTIEFNSESSIKLDNLEIYDITGKRVNQDNLLISNNFVDVSLLKNGVYFIRLNKHSNEILKFLKY